MVKFRSFVFVYRPNDSVGIPFQIFLSFRLPIAFDCLTYHSIETEARLTDRGNQIFRIKTQLFSALVVSRKLSEFNADFIAGLMLRSELSAI